MPRYCHRNLSRFLGSGPDRGRSPVEWGDFLSVRPYVRMSVRPSPLWAIQPGLRPSQPGLRPSQPGLRPSQPGLRPSQPGLRPSQPASKALGIRRDWLAGSHAWLDGPKGGTDRHTDRNSPHSTRLRPPMKTKEKVEQGKGTADHLMPLDCLCIRHAFFVMVGRTDFHRGFAT